MIPSYGQPGHLHLPPSSEWLWCFCLGICLGFPQDATGGQVLHDDTFLSLLVRDAFSELLFFLEKVDKALSSTGGRKTSQWAQVMNGGQIFSTCLTMSSLLSFSVAFSFCGVQWVPVPQKDNPFFPNTFNNQSFFFRTCKAQGSRQAYILFQLGALRSGARQSRTVDLQSKWPRSFSVVWSIVGEIEFHFSVVEKNYRKTIHFLRIGLTPFLTPSRVFLVGAHLVDVTRIVSQVSQPSVGWDVRFRLRWETETKIIHAVFSWDSPKFGSSSLKIHRHFTMQMCSMDFCWVLGAKWRNPK